MPSIVVFTLDVHRYALNLAAVERVVRAVEFVNLPNAPAIVLGVINVHGRIIPLFDVRSRFGLPVRGLALSDQIIIALAGRRNVALVADSVQGVSGYSDESMIPTADILPGNRLIRGVVALPDGLVLIHDLDAFLSPEEQRTLDEAMGAI